MAGGGLNSPGGASASTPLPKPWLKTAATQRAMGPSAPRNWGSPGPHKQHDAPHGEPQLELLGEGARRTWCRHAQRSDTPGSSLR